MLTVFTSSLEMARFSSLLRIHQQISSHILRKVYLLKYTNQS